jgi:hypothetical protein|tara:strand:+ start:11120 stop:11791 length:672 start_codon:yes stop_codon:yes gene_type:complete
MSISRKLIIEPPNYELNYIKEAKNKDSEERLYVEGVYMQYGKENKNHRKYIEEEMVTEVNRYTTEAIDTGSAVGELNHSQKPEIDLDRVCHRIVGLRQEGNSFIGKSMVTTSTPCGKILEGLINDGVRTGMSTKALGQIEEGSETNTVSNFMLIGVDSVHDPSCSSAFVNGILENKEFIIKSNENNEKAYEVFEQSLTKYPSKYRSEINEHVESAIDKFLKSL